jgi:hypothetical protein
MGNLTVHDAVTELTNNPGNYKTKEALLGLMEQLDVGRMERQAQSDIRFPPALCAAILELRCFASWNTNVGLRFAPSNLRLIHPTLA